MHGLHQQINLEHDYVLTISWIQTCLIVHSFAACVKDERYESDFWEWIDEGMSGKDREEETSVEGFRWNGAGQPVWGDRCSTGALLCPRSPLSHPLLVYLCTYIIHMSCLSCTDQQSDYE